MKEIKINYLSDLYDYKWTYKGCELILKRDDIRLLLTQGNVMTFNGETKNNDIGYFTSDNLEKLKLFGLTIIKKDTIERELQEYIYKEWGIIFQITDVNIAKISNNTGSVRIRLLNYKDGIKGISIRPIEGDPFFPTELFTYIESKWKANGNNFIKREDV